jgi:hypothetical protein
MTQLEKLDEKMAQLSTTANMKLEDIPSNVQGAWASAIRSAADELKEVRAKYRSVLLRNAVAILVNGDEAKVGEFVALAKDEGGIVVDATALYARLAKSIEPSLSEQRTWGVQQTHMLHKLLQEVMTELNLTELPMPARSLDTVVPTYQDVVNHCRKLIVDGVGNVLNALYLEEEVARRAFEIRYNGVMAPVLLVNAQADEASALAKSFGKGETAVLIANSDEINKDYLAKTLKKIRKK